MTPELQTNPNRKKLSLQVVCHHLEKHSGVLCHLLKPVMTELNACFKNFIPEFKRSVLLIRLYIVWLLLRCFSVCFAVLKSTPTPHYDLDLHLSLALCQGDTKCVCVFCLISKLYLGSWNEMKWTASWPPSVCPSKRRRKQRNEEITLFC